MITFPNAKINLGLNIVEKRADGYHNLETIFYPVQIEDALEVVPLKNSSKDFELEVLGIPVAGDDNENLVVKAYKLLKDKYELPPISIYLQKHIPSGAGMGGGSADGAFMLKLLNDQFQLNLSQHEMEDYATKLGADCPFFIANKPTYATGIGNIFSPINISLSEYYILVIKPDVFVSTKDAFALITPSIPSLKITEVVQMPIEQWKKYLINDFEKSVFTQYPSISKIKDLLYDAGAIYASMSGSGSSLYGIFSTPIENAEQLFEGHFVWQGKLG